MKDFEGSEILVGDEVIHMSRTGSTCWMRRRTVLEVGEQHALLTPNRFSNKNGRVTESHNLFRIPR